MRQKKLLFFLLFSLVSNFARPAVKGSETSISIEPFYTFLSADTDNTMLGFGWFKNGFALEDASTTCTFDSVFPVSGNIYLSGGALYLDSDLIFDEPTSFCTSGSIYANNHLLNLSSSVTGLGCDCNSQFF